jgi:hypothetical protein
MRLHARRTKVQQLIEVYSHSLVSHGGFHHQGFIASRCHFKPEKRNPTNRRSAPRGESHPEAKSQEMKPRYHTSFK